MQSKTELQTNLETVCDLAKQNKVEELRECLLQLETKLSGHYLWNYYTDKHLIEGAARDAILAGHEEILKLLFEAGLSPDDQVYLDDSKMK